MHPALSNSSRLHYANGPRSPGASHQGGLAKVPAAGRADNRCSTTGRESTMRGGAARASGATLGPNWSGRCATNAALDQGSPCRDGGSKRRGTASASSKATEWQSSTAAAAERGLPGGLSTWRNIAPGTPRPQAGRRCRASRGDGTLGLRQGDGRKTAGMSKWPLSMLMTGISTHMRRRQPRPPPPSATPTAPVYRRPRLRGHPTTARRGWLRTARLGLPVTESAPTTCGMLAEIRKTP